MTDARTTRGDVPDNLPPNIPPQSHHSNGKRVANILNIFSGSASINLNNPLNGGSTAINAISDIEKDDKLCNVKLNIIAHQKPIK